MYREDTAQIPPRARSSSWLAFVLGLALGISLTAAALILSDSWYEYRIADFGHEATAMVNSGDGWRVVPGQPNGLYLVRPRYTHR